VPPDLDGEGIARHRLRVENALLAATQTAEQWASDLAADGKPEPAAPVPRAHLQLAALSPPSPRAEQSSVYSPRE